MTKLKLPRTLVKPPAGFDNPFRRTDTSTESEGEGDPNATIEAALAPDTATNSSDTQTADATFSAAELEGPPEAELAQPAQAEPPATPTPIISIKQSKTPAPSARTAKKAAAAATSAPEQRITLRIDDVLWRALETECYKRRMAGIKTNITEIARDVLNDWAKAKPISLTK